MIPITSCLAPLYSYKGHPCVKSCKFVSLAVKEVLLLFPCLPACGHVTAWRITACYSNPIAQSKNSVGKEDYRKGGVNSKSDCDLFFKFSSMQC